MTSKTIYLSLILFLLGFSTPTKAAIYHTEDTIRAEVFLKMIPMQSSRLERLGLTTLESQMFREDDYIAYQSKNTRQTQKGRIIRFKDGEMWVHNVQSDKIDKVKTEDITMLKKQYNLSATASFITSFWGLYFLIAVLILLLFMLLLAAFSGVFNGTTTGNLPQGIASVFISTIMFAIVGAAFSYSGLKDLTRFRKYKIGKKWKTKLYEIKPFE
jgi:hypothetical protein